MCVSVYVFMLVESCHKLTIVFNHINLLCLCLTSHLTSCAQVRWSYIADRSVPCPPTAVLLHGILGSRKNWGE
ncbi:hypothetical protein HanLR1_Chr11g0387761 [Helianthus annuus]|nr:hypothetical protein HanLR1_Chr11g0387761 [Helianthus annuus]